MIGDLVLVVDDNSPRGPMAPWSCYQDFSGPSDQVRVAEIKTSTSTLTRPISKLCLLEEAAKKNLQAMFAGRSSLRNYLTI